MFHDSRLLSTTRADGIDSCIDLVAIGFKKRGLAGALFGSEKVADQETGLVIAAAFLAQVSASSLPRINNGGETLAVVGSNQLS